MKPETLAMRAVSEYRNRDILAYLGLRYYLENECARRDRWAREISTRLTTIREEPSYMEYMHFKEANALGDISHRAIALPGPNEAYSEAALLQACSQHKEFLSLDCVYSYRLTKRKKQNSLFEPYFNGFQERQSAVAKACRKGDVVLYTDIKKFYPSISKESALNAWNSACAKSNLAFEFKELGNHLLKDHIEFSSRRNSGKALLTGPMFSHLIANLVMRDIDVIMKEDFGKRYFRYVDDIVLVGTPNEVSEGRTKLKSLLANLELELHDGDNSKDFTISAEKWLLSANDFRQENSKLWMLFVGDLKRFITSDTSHGADLSKTFFEHEFRIPIPAYLNATKESTFRLGFRKFLSYSSLRNKFSRINQSHLLVRAQNMRAFFSDQLDSWIKAGENAIGYERKRVLPKIRYYAGRLLYLGTNDMLTKYSKALSKFPELLLISEVMNSVVTRDVSAVLRMGTNATQSAAQVLRLDDRPVYASNDVASEAFLQGLAILDIYQIKVSHPYLSENVRDSELNKFALWSEDSNKLFKSSNPFISEIACLHGFSRSAKHKAFLDSAFDPDENLYFDFINQIQQSSYF